MSDNRGFQVKDNRMFNPDGSLRDSTTPEAAPKPEAPRQVETPKEASRPAAGPRETAAQPQPSARPTERVPEAPSPQKDAYDRESATHQGYGEAIDFPTFVLSLASSVQVSLGIIPNPMTGQAETDLAHAKQTIDILGMLEDKTRGNLSPEESGLLKQVLFQLRMQFVEISKSTR